MHYFEYNIKDYRADAFQLTLIQHGAYKQLMDQYYLNEKPLTLNIDDLCYELLIRGDDEKKAIEFVLAKFFTKTENGYAHKRCDDVIEKYKAKSDQSRNAVNTRWAKEKAKKGDTGVIRETYERNTNQEPLTNNNEQETIKHISRPLDVNISIWEDYMHFRKVQNKPMYETTLKSIKKEAVQAGITLNQAITVCLENSWINFKAEWYEKIKGNSNPDGSTFRLPGK